MTKLHQAAELPASVGALLAVWVQMPLQLLIYLASKTFAEILTFCPLQILQSSNLVLVSPGSSRLSLQSPTHFARTLGPTRPWRRAGFPSGPTATSREQPGDEYPDLPGKPTHLQARMPLP